MNDQPQATNIAATIFIDLRKQILRGELSAGERLPGERELAAKYRTNRNTLREAVRKLEQSRLVTVRHGQGVTVCDYRKTGTMELLPPLLETAPDAFEIAHILEDILPARLLVIEFAARLAVRRANKSDMERLQDITELLIAAFQRHDPVVVARGFHRWLDAVIDAGHSVAIRWISNPFLEAYREVLDRFPALWVLEPSFPQHLQEFMTALNEGDEERAIETTRTYYRRVDAAFVKVLQGAIAPRGGGDSKSSPRAADRSSPRAADRSSPRAADRERRKPRGEPP
jgi:GntR family transcriptional regulator, transcriptional repressor for pyruvate dehydrogenase complex